MNSAGLANLAAVAAPNDAVIILDPNRVSGAPEIVVVTAHTGSATSATIVRGQEGTTAREHALGTEWVHGPTALDYAGRGVRLRRAAVQSIPDAALTAVSWDTEDFDSDGFITVPSTTITIPTARAGWYAITASIDFVSGVTGRGIMDIAAGGRIWRTEADVGADTWSSSATVLLAAADTVVVSVFQDSAGANNATAILEMVRIGP